MPEKKMQEYNNYYQSGSAARKLEYSNNKQKGINNKKRKARAIKTKQKARTSSIGMIFVVFSMALVLVYRYNVINEKNLKSQSLASDLTKVESGLLTSQIEVEQNTDLNQIEAYAKQKLGMQKPNKNQTIYVDTSKDSSLVEVKSDTTFIQNITESISNFISKIF